MDDTELEQHILGNPRIINRFRRWAQTHRPSVAHFDKPGEHLHQRTPGVSILRRVFFSNLLI